MSAEDQLTRVLSNRAAEVQDTVDLAEVRARVDRVRRRRRTTLALAAAAVVAAVVVPASLALQHPDATGPIAPTPTPNATPSPAPSPSPRQVQQLHPSEAFAMLPAGAPPKLAYVYGGHTLALPGQEPVALPAPMDGVTDLTSVGGGWLVASRTGADGSTGGGVDQGSYPNTLLDGQMQPVWTKPGNDRVVAGDGVVAWFADEAGTATLHLTGDDGSALAEWTLPPGGSFARPAGVVSGHQVAYTLTSPTGNLLSAWVTRPHDLSRRLPMSFATTASGDLVAGQLRNRCQVMWDLGTNRVLWRTCGGYRMAAFSPDGRYVAAWHTQTGGEYESVAIFDARTGVRVTDSTVDAPRAFHGLPSGDVAWEDDGHLLIAFIAEGDWATVRLALNGHLERATDALQTDTDQAFIFATQPLPPVHASQPSASPGPRSATHARTCHAADLTAAFRPRNEGGVDGAGGHQVFILDFRNTGTRPCQLTGYPQEVTVSQPGHPPVTATNGSFFPTGPSKPMKPGAVTSIGLETDSVCGRWPGGAPDSPLYHEVKIQLHGGTFELQAPHRRDELNPACGIHLTKFTTWR